MRRALPFLAAALSYALVAVFWAAPSSLAPRETVPDLGDPLHLSYVMAWDAHQLVRRPAALFQSNSFHPYPRSLAFADHLTPEALMVAPVFWATGNAVLAFNVAVLLALTLSALALCALVRTLTGRWDAAFLAGLAYAFNSFTLHELPRVHVLNVQWWPLVALFLVRFARDGHGRDAALAGVALALQSLSGTYYLAYSALLAPLWIAAAYAGTKRLPTRREAFVLAGALAVAAALLLPFVWPYLRQFREMGFEKDLVDGADLLSYVDPEADAALPWPRLGVARELPHFLGFAAAAAAVAGLVATARTAPGRRRAAGLLAAATAAVALVLSLGPVVRVGGAVLGPGPYALLHALVPPARGMASPERIGILVTFGVAILAGLGLAALLPRLGRTARLGATAALALALPLEHWGPPGRGAAVPAGADVPAVYGSLGGSAEPLVELPLYPDKARKLWAAHLYFSTIHWRPLPIGRTSFYPPAHDLLAWSLRGFPDAASLTLLDRLGIRTVVVHPRVWTADERRPRLATLETEPRLREVARFDDVPHVRFAALGLGEERVYALVPGPPPAAPCVPERPLDRAGWRIAGSGPDDAEAVRDGDARTAWKTAAPQRGGDRLEIGLAGPATVAAVALGLGYPFDEFPRHLVLAVDDVDAGWQRVGYADGPEERWETLHQLLVRPREAAWVLRFPARTVRGVRLMVGWRADDPSWPRWRVPELTLYGACS
ncbi:MAG: hypothetical protein ABW221_04750 [Vicinamibacteria bacterium]